MKTFDLMKKINMRSFLQGLSTGFIAVAWILILCACGSSMDKNYITDQPLSSAAVSIENSNSIAQIPDWAVPSQTHISLIKELNLDNCGGNDDECSIVIYRWGDLYPGIVSLCVKLGTGDVFTRIIPTDGGYTFNVGKLFSERKDAIILEINSATSNLGAASVYVFDICKDNDMISKPTMVERLNTAELITDLYESQYISGKIEENTITLLGPEISTTGTITDGTKIVDIDESSLQGITLFFTGKRLAWRECSQTLFWDVDKYQWALCDSEGEDL